MINSVYMYVPCGIIRFPRIHTIILNMCSYLNLKETIGTPILLPMAQPNVLFL